MKVRIDKKFKVVKNDCKNRIGEVGECVKCTDGVWGLIGRKVFLKFPDGKYEWFLEEQCKEEK